MKNYLLVCAFMALSISTTAQCFQEVDGFGNNQNIPMYNIMGDVDLTLNTDDTITLELGENFMTAAGPDIRAFLVNSGGLTDQELAQTLIANLENFEFGLVGGGGTNQNGAKTFTVDIPSEVEIRDFDKVFFYCLQFNQFWDFGTFTPFSNDNCAVLGLEDQIFNEISINPNPAIELVTVLNSTNIPLGISVYNMSGQEVISIKNSTLNAQTLDVSSLTSGIYLVSLESEGNTRTQRLIKQ